MNRRRLFLALALLPTSVLATDHFIIISGGPTARSSGVQIEFNVNWVVASLHDLLPDAVVSVFFANGKGAEKATVELIARREDVPPQLSALASIYGAETANRLRYRSHRVANVEGATRKDILVPELGRRLESLRPGDQAMIIYNGHGSWATDRAENSLRLWEETSLSVREFEKILGRVDPAVPVRFVLTQCFSGAFARAVHTDADHARELARGQRCGFLAESSERESEGCSASVELGDYRDYTTYFFAGLTGKDRLGRPVAAAKDRDGDGRITPFDAHLYTLVEGYNGDLPRSTSEDYLERWQPWQVRWVGTGTLPDNVNGSLAREMARRSKLPEDGRALGSALQSAYEALTGENAEAGRERHALEAAMDSTRLAIRQRIEHRWPELAHPYTEAHRELLAGGTNEIEQAILGDAVFPELQQGETRLAALGLRLVDFDRRISQLDKLRRTRMLARALYQLERRARPSIREEYGRLRTCEALPLGGN